MTCSLPTCDDETQDEGTDAHARNFCCKMHELKYNNLRAEAHEAQQLATEKIRDKEP